MALGQLPYFVHISPTFPANLFLILALRILTKGSCMRIKAVLELLIARVQSTPWAGILFSLMLTACSSGSSLTTSEDEGVGEDVDDVVIEPEDPSTGAPDALDLALDPIIETFALDLAIETTHLPDISEPLPQLGMKLFFSKSLGGGFDAACVSCHHPVLGGADQLSLSVGVDAVDPELLGTGRVHQDGVPLVPRNAPTVFNVGLWDTSLFWDSRVESLEKEPETNGAVSGIRTPDTDFLIADSNAGANLAAAQARFPVTSAAEMKSDFFEVGSDNETVRNHLAARIGDYGDGIGELAVNDWLQEFQQAFGTTASAETLITFDNIAHALGEYERSMVLIASPWRQYLEGDLEAMSDDAKRGAELFFTAVNDGGAGCANCHNGPIFSDSQHHVVAFPQDGPGKGDINDDDFGRERETGESDDRYRFRTPSLLNIAKTAPYGHAGAYQTLDEVVRHYTNPQQSVQGFFSDGGLCGTPQFADVVNCGSLYPNNAANSGLALDKLDEERDRGVSRFQSARLNNAEVQQLVTFLEALTDPCADDRDCLAAWIPDNQSEGPDGQQLNAEDVFGNAL